MLIWTILALRFLFWAVCSECRLITMVFRDTLKEPKAKVEGAGCDPSVILSLQNCPASNTPINFEEDLGCFQKICSL